MRDYSAPSSWLVYTISMHLRSWCQWLHNHLTPPPLRAFEISAGFITAQVLYSLKKVGVYDALAHGPKSADQLAKELGLHVDTLYRVMRAAVNMKLLTAAPGARGQPPRFANAALGEALRDDHPNNAWPMIQWTVDDGYPTLAALEPAIKTGKNAFRTKNDGKSLWELLKADPEREADFSRAMVASDDLYGIKAVVADFDWSRFARFVDIAGAYGLFLARLLRHAPRAEGVLFDQPQVIARSRQVWSKEADKVDLRSRTAFVSGDFFRSETMPQPKAGDAWVLRHILHDWNDADAARILAAMRAAMGSTPVTLCLCEFCIPREFDDTCMINIMADLMVMTLLASGRERTRAEWDTLLSSTGFKLRGITRTRGALCVVEAVPI